jgi:UDP-N-acetylglucosamine/UDP-N-acetylgalactosamine diphosphorylase
MMHHQRKNYWPMFRTLARVFLPNRFDWMLKRTARKGGKKILLGWNRGLGDIALGLYAMVQRIREIIPDAEITFVIRENLKDGFSMLEGVKTIIAPDWKRGTPARIDESLKKGFDLVIEKPSPTDWVRWQRGKVVPRLKWNREHDDLHEKFHLDGMYVGVQVSAETNYGLWRNWPLEKWQELFNRLEKMGVKVLLFGFGNEPQFPNSNIVDLRGKTTLFELLSIIKKRVFALVLPDSGVSSMTYYLDESFPIRLVTLWADPNHGILKQQVPSPNPQLVHCPLIGENRDLSTVSVDAVVGELIGLKKSGAILLAGGQGTRLGYQGPKGLFPIGGKTLFKWICDKVPKDLPLAIMTSPLNHEETVSYFKENGYFGLDVHFFQQEMGPVLDEEKRPIDLKSPNGNGSVFRAFVNAGLADLFAKRGIDLVTVNYIDNPLSHPFDPALLMSQRLQQADVVVQCIERAPTDRSMGVLVENGEKIQIVEYTDLDPKKEYKYAYSGQLTFSLSFFMEMAKVELPVHWVRKTMDGLQVWKGEEFIFDVFPHAKKIRSLCVRRETHYAPIKGPESIERVQNLLRGKV